MADEKYVMCGPTTVSEPDVVREFADGHMERTEGRTHHEYVIAEQTRCLDGTLGRLHRLCICEGRIEAEMVLNLLNVGHEALMQRHLSRKGKP